MEVTRVVAVQPGDSRDGSAGPGSGYVIAPRLVLTSAHAVPDPGTPGSGTPGRGRAVQVLVAADPVAYTGVVVWRGTPGGRDDAALVESTTPPGVTGGGRRCDGGGWSPTGPGRLPGVGITGVGAAGGSGGGDAQPPGR